MALAAVVRACVYACMPVGQGLGYVVVRASMDRSVVAHHRHDHAVLQLPARVKRDGHAHMVELLAYLASDEGEDHEQEQGERHGCRLTQR